MSRNLWHINTLEKISIPRMVIQNNNKRKLHIVEKFTEFAYWCHDFLSGGRVVVLVRWCRWVKGLAAALVVGIQVLSCHCVNGDGKTVQEKKKERKLSRRCLIVAEIEQNAALQWNHTGFCGRVHVYMCVYLVWVRVCLYILTGESLCRLLLWRSGEREEAKLLTHCVSFFHTASSLLTMLSSRHSQDLNDPPQAAESADTWPTADVCFTDVKDVCSPFNAVCVRVCVRRPRESPGALFARCHCLVDPPRAPSRGIFSFCFLWSHCSLYTHIHSQMHIHAQ